MWYKIHRIPLGGFIDSVLIINSWFLVFVTNLFSQCCDPGLLICASFEADVPNRFIGRFINEG